MAQVLSTFSRLEQSRFEAFRRATFPSDAISKYVAHCLLQQDPTRRKQVPVLSHVCAPGQSEEIVIVVNTLAKAYAQRLVTAARRAAPDDTPIQPQHILDAFQERQAQGLDPGFFLQPSEQSTSLQLNNKEHSKKRLAALHLQDEYDKEQVKLAEKETKLAEAKEKLKNLYEGKKPPSADLKAEVTVAEEEKKLVVDEKEEATGMDISPTKEDKVEEPATEPAKAETWWLIRDYWSYLELDTVFHLRSLYSLIRASYFTRFISWKQVTLEWLILGYSRLVDDCCCLQSSTFTSSSAMPWVPIHTHDASIQSQASFYFISLYSRLTKSSHSVLRASS